MTKRDDITTKIQNYLDKLMNAEELGRNLAKEIETNPAAHRAKLMAVKRSLDTTGSRRKFTGLKDVTFSSERYLCMRFGALSQTFLCLTTECVVAQL